MDKHKTLNYLKLVLRLEENKLEAKRIKDDLDAKNVYGANVNDNDYVVRNKYDGIIGKLILTIILGAAFGFGALFVVFFVVEVLSFGTAELNDFVAYTAMSIGAIIGLGYGIGRISSALSYNENAIKKQQTIKTLNAERSQKYMILTNASNEIEKAYQDAKNKLDNLYAANIIYPKYRNIIAVASFCEYFETGRCETLDGPDGAYSIYELESRLDKIITRLDDIILNLERIQQNQFTLYNAIRDMNARIETITDKIEQNTMALNAVAASSAATAYTTQLIEKNTRLIEKNQFYNRTFENTAVF